MVKTINRLRKQVQSRKKNKPLYYLMLSKVEQNTSRRVRQLAMAMRLVVRDSNENAFRRIGLSQFHRHKIRFLKVLALRMQ